MAESMTSKQNEETGSDDLIDALLEKHGLARTRL
jgi:hypothetical protein